MTEKQYGGTKSHGHKDHHATSKAHAHASVIPAEKSEDKETESDSQNLTKEEIEKLTKAGYISKQTVAYARQLITRDMPLLEIAEKIEEHIVKLGGKPAFPVNLSKNEIAAHATPAYNDTETACGLLKVDLGVHIEGWAADTAFSIDLENKEENRLLIQAAEKALAKATEIFALDKPLNEIGDAIEKTVTSFNFSPIKNLSGHSIERYDLHAGITIPNVNHQQAFKLIPGIYAIEPFTTNGLGIVRDGKPSGIYQLQKEGNVRDDFARDVLSFIKEEYHTLPFCARWLIKRFGTRALIALVRLQEAGLLHHYAQLIESGKGKVAQAEHTIVLTAKEKIVTTA